MSPLFLAKDDPGTDEWRFCCKKILTHQSERCITRFSPGKLAKTVPFLQVLRCCCSNYMLHVHFSEFFATEPNSLIHACTGSVTL